MKKRKNVLILSIIAVAVVIAAALLVYFAKGYSIRFDGGFPKDLSFEYGSEADLPKAYAVNKFGVRQLGKVEYHFTSPDGKESVSTYPVATCEKVGEWKLTCVYESAKEEMTYQVVDTVAPEIIIGSLPSDVYVGNKDTEYTVPAVDFKDASAIDYAKCSAILYFEGKETTYNSITSAFVPEKDGEWVYKITASDIYGNTSNAECKWRSKDPNWKDTKIPEGYLATFDKVGYTNLVSSGFVNEYWSGTETEEWLEEYEGEKGVLKVTAKLNSLGLTAFNLKLAKTISLDQLGDNVVIIRYRIDDKNASENFKVAGSYQEEIKTAACKDFEFKKGEWQTAALTADDLKSYMISDKKDILKDLTVALSGTGKEINIYLASVTVGKKLEAPKNLKVSGSNLVWDTVKNASGYYIYTEGAKKETEVKKNSYAVGKKKLFKVRAKGDGLFYVDSNESIYVNDTPAKGYLAEFDEEFYKYLVWNNGARAEGGMDWYECDAFETSYDKKEKAIRLDMTRGYVSAGIVVRLPKAVKTETLDSVVVRFKADKNVKRATVYQYGGPALLADVTEIKEGWNTIILPKKLLVGDAEDSSLFSGYQIMFYESKEPVHGDGQGTKMTVYLSSVTKATQLAAPTKIEASGKKLKWGAVSHAKGYAISRDGGAYKTISQNYANLDKTELFQIKAVGDNKFYVDSESTVYVNGKVKNGYLAEFNKPYYEHLIWNNGADAPGGMQWYQSDSFKASYDKKEQALKVEMTMGYVGAGSVLRFPKSAKVSELNDLVIRMKLESNVKAVAIYQYGGVGRMYYTNEVKAGWNSIAIPHNAILADGGSNDTISGLQIILYGSEEMGVAQGKKTTMYLKSVTNAVRLTEPQNLKLTGKKLTWDAVTGAKGYTVIEDGKSTTVKTNSYTIKGGNLFKVAALGDGIRYVDSGYAIYVNATVKSGYIATFDKAFYEYLIWNNGANAEGGMQWYESQTHAVQYDAKAKTTKVTMTMGYVGAGSVIKFPKAVKLSEIDDLVVYVKLDSAVKKIGFYQYGGIGNIYHTEAVAPGWNTIVIPKDKLLADAGVNGTMSGIQLILYGANGNGGDVGKKTTMTLGYIASIRKLAAPTNIQIQGNKLTWDKVDGAVKYIVYEDGKKYTATTNSHTLKGGELIKIQAIGDGKQTADSELSMYINANVKAGYLAECNKEYYNYLIWNNGAEAPGGMQWYDSASFKAAFNKTEKVLDVTAKYGYVCAGMVLRFPQGKALEAGKDVVVNIKLDSTVKYIRFYPYGQSGNLYETANVKAGWNQFVIPAENVAAAVGNNSFDGIQIVLCDNPDGAFTVNNPAKTAKISIGTIHYAQTLAKPTLTIEGDVAKWNRVEHADAYEVYADGKKLATVTSCEYSLATLADGVYQIQVIAKSNSALYVAATSNSVKYSNLEILSVPTMSYSDGTVTFTPVTGAASYKIEIDGTEYDIDKNATSVKPAELIGKSILVKYRMKSIGDNLATVDSDWSDYAMADLSLENNVIADYDEGYTKLVWNNGAKAEGGQAWYESDAFAAAYDANEKGISLTMKYGYVCAGFVTKFPSPIHIDDADSIVLRIKLDKNIKYLRVFEYGGTGVMLDFKDLQEGWNELSIPKSNLKNDPGKDYISGLQIAMYTSTNPENGTSQGTEIKAVLGSVKKVKVQAETENVIFTRTENGQYDNSNTIYLTNNDVYGKIPSASAGVSLTTIGEGSGIYVDGVLDTEATFATAQSRNGVFWIRPSKAAVAGTVLTFKGVFSSSDGSYQFPVEECSWQYDGSKWSVYQETTTKYENLEPKVYGYWETDQSKPNLNQSVSFHVDGVNGIGSIPQPDASNRQHTIEFVPVDGGALYRNGVKDSKMKLYTWAGSGDTMQFVIKWTDSDDTSCNSGDVFAIEGKFRYVVNGATYLLNFKRAEFVWNGSDWDQVVVKRFTNLTPEVYGYNQTGQSNPETNKSVSFYVKGVSGIGTIPFTYATRDKKYTPVESGTFYRNGVATKEMELYAFAGSGNDEMQFTLTWANAADTSCKHGDSFGLSGAFQHRSGNTLYILEFADTQFGYDTKSDATYVDGNGLPMRWRKIETITFSSLTPVVYSYADTGQSRPEVNQSVSFHVDGVSGIGNIPFTYATREIKYRPTQDGAIYRNGTSVADMELYSFAGSGNDSMQFTLTWEHSSDLVCEDGESFKIEGSFKYYDATTFKNYILDFEPTEFVWDSSKLSNMGATGDWNQVK